MNDKDAILAANSAYYQAFAAGDFALMSRLWAENDVSCVHPGWPALIGRRAVLESYRNIMRHPHQERVEHLDDTVIVAGEEGRVLCVESVGGLALAATNWFRRIDGAWRMIHHQASPISGLSTQEAPPPGRLN